MCYTHMLILSKGVFPFSFYIALQSSLVHLCVFTRMQKFPKGSRSPNAHTCLGIYKSPQGQTIFITIRTLFSLYTTLTVLIMQKQQITHSRLKTMAAPVVMAPVSSSQRHNAKGVIGVLVLKVQQGCIIFYEQWEWTIRLLGSSLLWFWTSCKKKSFYLSTQMKSVNAQPQVRMF